ncbi:regulatory protein TetR [Sphingobium chlorophenolicum L-1]|uniref:Regulatory protein TetR n=1 Tax=Sphingobium chlorophenolicum L-1 TaxID=690566 RepID=F6F1K9_SPHCR|nr:regulatory protein TetR [Sphingobium chlorophenolicum L-1]
MNAPRPRVPRAELPIYQKEASEIRQENTAVTQVQDTIDAKKKPPAKAGGPGTRGPHTVRREITRQRVFEAAIDCLHETGYAGASTLAVARRAGVSRGALMKQFPTKATLFADLVEHFLDQMREETLNHIRKFPAGLPRIMARVDYAWELYKKPKALAIVEVMLGARGDPELSERLAQVGRTRQIIEQHLLGEEFRQMGLTDRRAAGYAIMQMAAAVRGLALERLLNRDSQSVDAAFALQKQQTEEFFRALIKASGKAES